MLKLILFLGGKGVHVAADRIDLAGNVFGSTVFGALEDHVFDEMGYAIPLQVLSRDPVLIQIPIETERICSISSVMMDSPLGRLRGLYCELLQP